MVQFLFRTVPVDPYAVPVERHQVLVSCSVNGAPFRAELDVDVPPGTQLVNVTAFGPQV